MFHDTVSNTMRTCLEHIEFWLAALLLAILASAAEARPVMVGDETGNGYLFRHRGVCYVILPTHVHGRGSFALSARDPAGLGSGRIIHQAEDTLDLSLGVVSGSLTEDCGADWKDLPRQIEPVPGQQVSVIRYHAGSVETIRSVISTVTFTHFEIVPIPEETRFFAARSSGSFVFNGQTPIGMIVEAGDRQSAYVLRMDEIRDRLRRVVEDWFEEQGCTEATGCDSPLPDPAPSTLSGFRLVSWAPQAITSAQGADAMISGLAPYIAPISRTQPIRLTFEAETIQQVSRVTIRSLADSIASFSPKLVVVQVDTSSDGIERWRNFRSPTDMTPDAVLDLRRGATHARRLRIEIRSGWGDGPIRIDGVTIE